MFLLRGCVGLKLALTVFFVCIFLGMMFFQEWFLDNPHVSSSLYFDRALLNGIFETLPI